MIIAPASHQYLVHKNSQPIDFLSCAVPTLSADKCAKKLKKNLKKISKLQQRLYAQDKYSILLIFQAMDAAGKDSTIRAVTTGINPAGFQAYSFKQPSKEELDHDFLWRTNKCLPEKGRIGIFNRSYYEEVLVVRVHPEYLKNQRISIADKSAQLRLWQERFHSIREHELHLARNNTMVIKFWLNLSKDEQRKRFISRIDEASKNWKFSAGDLKERALWDKYMTAYQEMVLNTSKDYAPWYVIPADNKPYMRWQVSKIIYQTLKNLNPMFPKISKKQTSELEQYKYDLQNEN